jgi:hypothetical protein
MALFEFVKRRGFPYLTGIYALGSFASAYWDSARRLVDIGAFEDRGRPDFSVFPIAFLYRHALELMMKAILVEHGARVGYTAQAVLAMGHRLGWMPDQIQRAVVSFGVLVDGTPVIQVRDEDWKQLRAVVQDWNQEEGDPDSFTLGDPDSATFRYGVEKDARTARIRQDSTFDIRKFAQVMNSVLEFLAELKVEMDDIVSDEVTNDEVGPL